MKCVVDGSLLKHVLGNPRIPANAAPRIFPRLFGNQPIMQYHRRYFPPLVAGIPSALGAGNVPHAITLRREGASWTDDSDAKQLSAERTASYNRGSGNPRHPGLRRSLVILALACTFVVATAGLARGDS